MSDDRVIKSYVWHGEKCFFVSTIERGRSAAMAYGARYNETLVWEYDWAKQEREGLLYQEEEKEPERDEPSMGEQPPHWAGMPGTEERPLKVRQGGGL